MKRQKGLVICERLLIPKFPILLIRIISVFSFLDFKQICFFFLHSFNLLGTDTETCHRHRIISNLHNTRKNSGSWCLISLVKIND